MKRRIDRPGPKRRHNPAIPKHIDQARLPAGVYFDARGRGRWYVQFRDEAGKLRRNNIADSFATLSELHRIVEQRNSIDRESLRFLADQFHQSAQFKDLAIKTQQDYEYCRQVLIEMPTKLGKPLGDLATRQFKPALIQRLVDKIADEGPHPRQTTCCDTCVACFAGGSTAVSVKPIPPKASKQPRKENSDGYQNSPR